MTRLRVALVICFAAVFAFYIWQTIHWPMLWDTPIMHYVRFMISRGLHPYSDITDMNLPGCYLTEAWGMAIFGWSDLSWRFYEFFEMLLLAGAGMGFGGKRNWTMGIFAATFFVIMHVSEGPRVATERDELMAVLLVIAGAATIAALRNLRAPWMLIAGAASALAVSIKPAAVLMNLGLLVIAIVHLRREKQASRAYILWMLLGDLTIATVVFEFLYVHHAFGPLWFIATKIVPNYTKLVQPGMPYMLRHALPAAIALPVLFALLVTKRGKLGTERTILLLGIIVSAISYFMQHKALLYHRYGLVIFVMLWAGWEISEAMHREHTRTRALATAAIASLCLILVPYYIHLTLPNPRSAVELSPLSFALQHDLEHLGGDSLQGRVLCLDMINGCFDALYRMRIMQNTGSTGDTLLFSYTHDFAIDHYQAIFQQHQLANPADVVVLENEWYQNDQRASFAKIDSWPWYADFLRSNYTRVQERHFGPGEWAPAYRIYVRNKLIENEIPAGSL